MIQLCLLLHCSEVPICSSSLSHSELVPWRKLWVLECSAADSLGEVWSFPVPGFPVPPEWSLMWSSLLFPSGLEPFVSQCLRILVTCTLYRATDPFMGMLNKSPSVFNMGLYKLTGLDSFSGRHHSLCRRQTEPIFLISSKATRLLAAFQHEFHVSEWPSFFLASLISW